jgi:hypothetical protein
MRGSGDIDPPFLASGLDGGEWLASRLGRFNPEEITSSTRLIGGWVGFSFCLDAAEKILNLSCLESNPGNPGHSPSNINCYNINITLGRYLKKLLRKTYAQKYSKLPQGYPSYKIKIFLFTKKLEAALFHFSLQSLLGSSPSTYCGRIILSG